MSSKPGAIQATEQRIMVGKPKAKVLVLKALTLTKLGQLSIR